MTNTLTKNNIRYGYADYFYCLFFGGMWGFGAGAHGSNGGKEEAPEYLTIENMYPLYANGTVSGTYKEDLVYSPHQHYWNSWTNFWGSDTSKHDDYATYKETLYYGSDILGSIRTATDTYARLSGNISYDVFGSPYNRSGTFLNSESLDFGYLGKPYKAATGLYDYGFRDYSPCTARFTTLDPIRDGRNWYAYVLNDPVNFVDLWGLSRESDNISSVYTWLYDAMDFISKNVEDKYDNMLNTKLTEMMNNGKVQFDDITRRYESTKHTGHSSNTYAFFDPFRNTETNEPRNIIVIDINKTLETGYAELIDTLAHEGWHAVQEDLGLISVNEENELNCYPNIEKIEYDAYYMGNRMYNKYAEHNNLEKKAIGNFNQIGDN